MKIGSNLPDIGHHLIFLDEIGSTQDFASDILRKQPDVHGVAVIANHQTLGRGRLDKKWIDAKGQNFMGSVIIQSIPLLSSDQLGLISMLTSIALYNTVQAFVPTSVSIKWPNDIVVDSKKVAGILIQNQWKGNQWYASLLGIGVNLNQTEFHESLHQAASLKLLSQSNIDKNNFINHLMQSLNQYYNLLVFGDTDSIIKKYHASLFGNQDKISFVLNEKEYFGEIKSVNNQGLINIVSSLGNNWYEMDQIKINY